MRNFNNKTRQLVRADDNVTRAHVICFPKNGEKTMFNLNRIKQLFYRACNQLRCIIDPIYATRWIISHFRKSWKTNTLQWRQHVHVTKSYFKIQRLFNQFPSSHNRDRKGKMITQRIFRPPNHLRIFYIFTGIDIKILNQRLWYVSNECDFSMLT